MELTTESLNLLGFDEIALEKGGRFRCKKNSHIFYFTEEELKALVESRKRQRRVSAITDWVSIFTNPSLPQEEREPRSG